MAQNEIPKIVYDGKTLEFGYPLDAARSWPEPDEGSELVKAPSGTRDAWITRTVQRLAGTVRWIPPSTGTGFGSVPISGWDADPGFSDFLTYARDGNSFSFFPDRGSATSITSYLVEPFRGEPDQEDDATRSIRLVIESSDGTAYTGY